MLETVRNLINTLLPVVAILLIIVVGMQGAKADGASSFIVGGAEDRLFAESKDRGFEVFLIRSTWTLATLLLLFSIIRLAIF